MSTSSLITNIIFVLNVLWFGVAFRYFSLTPDTAARLLVPKSARESPLFGTVSASVRFLGGMNFAFAAFALLLLLNRGLFPEAKQGGAVCGGVFHRTCQPVCV